MMRSRSAKRAWARTRVLVSLGTGLVMMGIAAAVMPVQVAVLVGWDVAGLVTLAWVLLETAGKDSKETAALATREDDSRLAADLLLVSASVVSLVAVGAGLVKAASEHGGAKAAITVVAVASVVLAWAVVHCVFTLRYAHLYYSAGSGIDFGEDGDPDFRDFAYVAFTIGMTYQVSDTNLTTKPIRRAALRHALLSYLFGTAVVATTINVAAGIMV